jgi:hypothetical protein
MSKLTALEMLAEALKEDFDLTSSIVDITFMETENCPAMFNKYFVLIIYDDEFYLSFNLNYCSVYDVAFYTQNLTLMFGTDLVIYLDHYVDTKEGHLYFGDSAHNKNTESINNRKGIKTCPMCDRDFPFEMFAKDHNFCVICEKMVLPNIKFH